MTRILSRLIDWRQFERLPIGVGIGKVSRFLHLKFLDFP